MDHSQATGKIPVEARVRAGEDVYGIRLVGIVPVDNTYKAEGGSLGCPSFWNPSPTRFRV